MDRLQEANKVASVMRRREQMKPLQAAAENEASLAQRGFMQAKFVGTPRPPLTSSHGLRLAGAKIAGEPHDFFRPKPAHTVAEGKPAAAAPVRFSARRQPFMTVSRFRRQSVRMRQAPVARHTHNGSKTGDRRREFGMARLTRRRSVFTVRRQKAPRVQLPGALQNTKGGCNRPVRGNALRVSCGCGFRVAARKQRAFPPSQARTVSGMRWPQRTYGPTAKAPRRLPLFLAPAMAIPLAGMFCPPWPGHGERSPKLRSGPARPSMSAARAGISLTSRLTGGKWGAATSVMVLRGFDARNWKAGLADALPHKSMTPPPAAGRGESRHSVAQFVPQDMVCGPAFNVGQNGHKDQKR